MKVIQFRLSSLLLIVAIVSVALAWALDHARLSNLVREEAERGYSRRNASFQRAVANAEMMIVHHELSPARLRDLQAYRKEQLLKVICDLYENLDNTALGLKIPPDGVESRVLYIEELAGRALGLLDIERASDLRVLVEYNYSGTIESRLTLVDHGHMTVAGGMSDDFAAFVHRAMDAHRRALTEMKQFLPTDSSLTPSQEKAERDRLR